ncbi:MAG: threonine synthase, partial [Vicinamibacterales bacterium]|nr:threonine synthase [Vicinamibacterales bacterium]
TRMSVFAGLRCAMCKTEFPAEALYVCDRCLGPLEACYDYDAARWTMTRETIADRPRNLWRFRELLPITGDPLTGLDSGYTPLVRAGRLAEALGVEELYIKDDSVNHPTLSYKDRVVPVAATRAIELGFETFGCASTGNLGNSVAAHAARLGLTCYVFIPKSLEPGKIVGSAVSGPHVVGIDGTYDDVNRLCTQVGDRYGWAFANINLRSYYAEGAKTYGFEIVEQLGWRFPRHVVSPVAGGTLLPRIGRAFRELRDIGLASGELPRIHAAQAAGCAPVINALESGATHPEPVKPDTVAKSIAIGNPADGYQVLATVRASGGSGARATDPEILDAIELLARTEGIFTEPAGGTTLAATINLLKAGAIPKNESIVVCITGNGYKTSNVMADRLAQPTQLGRSLREFEAFLADRAEQPANV